jgi:hypothetical protein
MAIRYIIPAVGAQKGPTCWYYTMKMLLRFHAKIGDGETLETGWKKLHRLRQVLTEMASENVDRTKQNIVARFTHMMQMETDGTKRAQLREIRANVQNAASVERFNITGSFLPNAIDPVPLGDHAFNVDFVEWALTNHGPLYSSIYALGGGIFDRDFVEDPMEPGKYIYKLDGTAQVGGLHAICISGVDDDGNVYYNDPQCPHRFTMVAWDVLSRVINSPGGSVGDSLFGAVRCAGCNHLANHL